MSTATTAMQLWAEHSIGRAFLEGRKNDVLTLLGQGVALKQSYLSWAVRHHKEWMIEPCFKAGLDVNAQDNEGLTPLHHAVLGRDEIRFSAERFANDNIINMLEEAGADPRIQDKHGRSVIELAKELKYDELALRFERMGLAIAIPASSNIVPIRRVRL